MATVNTVDAAALATYTFTVMDFGNPTITFGASVNFVNVYPGADPSFT